MKEPAPRPFRSHSFEDEAAGWVLRQDRGLTAAEQDEFLQWLAADRQHGAALARHRQNWDRLNLLGQWRPEHSRRPNRDLLAPSPALSMSNGLAPEKPQPTWWASELARAIHATARSASKLAGPPEPAAKVVRFPRAWLAGLSVAAALVITGLVVWPRFTAEPAPSLSSPVATIEERTLPDGSVISLNRGTEIVVDYASAERRVQLVRGEAHFEVAKNPARPFIVSAAGVDVRAVGTAFNVRLGLQAVDVLVTEGKVRIEQADPAVEGGRITVVPLLVLGQRTVVPLMPSATRPAVAEVPPEQASEMLAWQPRMLEFNSAPLRAVVAEFNRCNVPIHLVIADGELADMEVSASLRSDNVEGFIRLLNAGFAVETSRANNTITLHRR